jgi:hypothetical protein
MKENFQNLSWFRVGVIAIAGVVVYFVLLGL